MAIALTPSPGRATGQCTHQPACPSADAPDREGVGPAGLSFGDGPHRYPGARIAIQETDIFLSRLFAEPGLRMDRSPRVSMKDEISSYELRDLTVSVRPDIPATNAG
jgi:cytochrome P450